MYPVSSTSALILFFTDRSLYQGPAAKRFFDSLDLSSGRPLYNKFNQIWEHIDQEITNRKFGVKKFCHNFLENKKGVQVVFLGAGLDPNSLETAANFPESRVFDVDLDNMDIKADINRKIQGPQNIEFCKADLGHSPEVLAALKKRGWDANKTTLIVAEGICYYIDESQFKDLLSHLKTPGGGLILEYSVPDIAVDTDKMRSIYSRYFSSIQEVLGLPRPLVRYSIEKVDSLAHGLGGKLTSTLNQQELEKERLKRTEHYALNTGIVHVSFIDFPQ